MFRQIRSLLGENVGQLFGEVEAEETCYGGGWRGTRRGRLRPESHKVPVVGIAQRGGKVAALVAKGASKAAIRLIICQHVLPSTMV